jgi:hypothetical protein
MTSTTQRTQDTLQQRELEHARELLGARTQALENAGRLQSELELLRARIETLEKQPPPRR